MQSIDVHDLPEPVAKAIEAMVQTLRQAAHRTGGDDHTATAAERLGPILAEAKSLPRRSDVPSPRGQEDEAHRLIAEKFQKQGLKL